MIKLFNLCKELLNLDKLGRADLAMYMKQGKDIQQYKMFS